MRNKTKRLSALGATALVALVVIGPAAGVAHGATTTTIAGETTTSTVPVQKKIHGSMTDNNKCTSILDLGSPGAPMPQDIGVTMSADAFPQPHLGDKIALTNALITFKIPAALLQQGVDAGIITDGQEIPSHVNLVIAGTGTKEQTKSFGIDTLVTISVAGTVAQPLESTVAIPNSNWTPASPTTDVFFSEKSVKIVSTIDLSASIGVIATATFPCAPRSSATFLSVGATGVAASTTTVATTTVPTTTAAAPTTVAAAATGDQLPRTGSNAGLLLALAVVFLSGGLFALKAAGRNRGSMTRVER